MRNKHYLTWNMARPLKNMENEKCRLQDLDFARKLKIMENEKYTLQDMENGEKTENHG